MRLGNKKLLCNRKKMMLAIAAKQRAVCAILFALPCFSNISAIAATKSGQSDDGLTVTAEVDPFPGTTQIASRLNKAMKETQALRSKILAIQDDLVAQLKDVVNIRIEAEASNTDQEKQPIGFVEITAYINDVELVRYVQPPMIQKSPRYPLYAGPIPVGTYHLKIHSVAGILQHGWPYSLLQGRWNVEKTFTLTIDPSMNGKTALIALKPGDISPSLSLTKLEGSPP